MRLNLAQSGAAQGTGSKECGLQCMSLLSRDHSRHSYELPLLLFFDSASCCMCMQTLAEHMPTVLLQGVVR